MVNKPHYLSGTCTGKVATVGPDRLPHVVPVWFHLDGDEIIFITSDHTMKAKNLRREGHVAMCVDWAAEQCYERVDSAYSSKKSHL